jgi:hypothetical protein
MTVHAEEEMVNDNLTIFDFAIIVEKKVRVYAILAGATVTGMIGLEGRSIRR